jgi:hypothetical protein
MHRACTDNRTHTDNRIGTDHQAEQSFLSPYHIVRILKDYFGGMDNLGSQSLHLEGERESTKVTQLRADCSFHKQQLYSGHGTY